MSIMGGGIVIDLQTLESLQTLERVPANNRQCVDRVTSLIELAAREYLTTKYVNTPENFLETIPPIKFWFGEIYCKGLRLDGIYQVNSDKTESIGINVGQLEKDVNVLSTAFHELSHSYDYRRGLIPAVLTVPNLVRIATEVRAYGRELNFLRQLGPEFWLSETHKAQKISDISSIFQFYLSECVLWNGRL